MWFNGWTILSWLEHTNHKRYYLVYHTNEAVDAVSVLYFFDMLELSLQTHQQATIRHIDQTTHYCHPPHLHFTIIFVLIFENFSVHAIIIIVQQSVLKDKNSELHEILPSNSPYKRQGPVCCPCTTSMQEQAKICQFPSEDKYRC